MTRSKTSPVSHFLSDQEPREPRVERKRRVTFEDSDDRLPSQRQRPAAAAVPTNEPEGEVAASLAASSGESTSSSSSSSSSSTSGPPSTAPTPRGGEERRESRQSAATEPEQEASVVSEGGPAGSPEGYGPAVQRTVRPSPSVRSEGP